MRPDILSVLKNSNSRFVRDLLGKSCFVAFCLSCDWPDIITLGWAERY